EIVGCQPRVARQRSGYPGLCCTTLSALVACGELVEPGEGQGGVAHSAIAHSPTPLLSTLHFPAQLGPRQHLDDAALHAPQRARACGRGESRGRISAIHLPSGGVYTTGMSTAAPNPLPAGVPPRPERAPTRGRGNPEAPPMRWPWGRCCVSFL